MTLPEHLHQWNENSARLEMGHRGYEALSNEMVNIFLKTHQPCIYSYILLQVYNNSVIFKSIREKRLVKIAF